MSYRGAFEIYVLQRASFLVHFPSPVCHRSPIVVRSALACKYTHAFTIAVLPGELLPESGCFAENDTPIVESSRQ